jgi:hypothetical protein
MSATITDQAIRFLVDRRWPMLPSNGPQKKPCIAWKQFQEQLPTVEQLRGWEREFRPARWGLVTGELAGIVVVDFDGDKGSELMEKWGIKPHLRTGSGGFHVHVKHPGWRVPTLNAKSGKASWPWLGLDIRGDGGFAVLLGRNSNGPYVQLRDLVPEPFDVLPEEVRTLLRDRGGQENVPPKPPESTHQPVAGRRADSQSIIRRALTIAPRDGRNNAGFWLACQLRDNGYSSGEAEVVMRDYRLQVPYSNTKGKPEAYTEPEMKASLREAYSKPAREPWARREALPYLVGVSKARADAGRREDDHTANEEEPAEGDDSADDPESIDIYVGHTDEPLVGHMGEPLPRIRYSRVPSEVSADRRLKPRDVCVYAVLATFCWQGSVAQVGKRLIARLAGCAERLVISSLHNLRSAGHIEKQPGQLRGQRGRYVLLSPVFGQKQRAGVEEVAMGRSGRRRLVAVRKGQGTAVTLVSSPNPHAALLKRRDGTKHR